MYLDCDPNKLYFVDIETDGLNPTKVWCVVVKHKASSQVCAFFTKPEQSSFYSELKAFFDPLVASGAVLCGHNFVSFDGPVLARLCDVTVPLAQQLDTLVLSYLYNPALDGGHSLEAYGERFKFPKVAHEDWSHFSPEMLHRCTQDVELTERVYDALTTKMNRVGFSDLSCEIEHYTRELVDRQQAHGFYFDKARATDLYNFLRQRESDLAVPIQKLFPPKLEELGTYSRRQRKDGSDSAQYLKHVEKYPVVRLNDDGSYTCFDYFEFNIGSPNQRLERLLELGFVPTAKTKKGNPRVDEDSLLSFAKTCDRPEVVAMAEWLVCNGRANMVQTWLNNVGPDSRIHGKVMTCGATTRRMTHSAPNTANIPSAAKAQYGKECRSLWSLEPHRGLKLVGVDAKSLETIGLLHYLGNKSAEGILNGPVSVHDMNAADLTERLGRPIDREWGAKTCVPSDTQMLTRRGWKKYDQLIVGEEVLGYNQETKLKEWTILRGINVCEDEVLEFGNSLRTFRATASHKWFVRQRTGKRVKYFSDEVRRTDELTSESCIVINAPFNEAQDKTSTSEWSKSKKYGTDWTQRVLEMSQTERKQFLQGFLLADGCIVEGDHWAWSQNKTEIAEGLLLASYLVNDGQIHVAERTTPSNEMVIVTLVKKSHITYQKMNTKSLGIQTVWCPATDLGSWVLRQGYNISISSNSWYAWLYGAYPPKLGSIVKGPASDGEIVVKTFFKNVPGLEKLIKRVHNKWKNNGGLLRTVDGGYVRCPSEHAALNYKVQSLGAIVMKLAAIILDRTARDQGLVFHVIGTIHDEWQIETAEQDAEKVGLLAVDCIRQAAEQLQFKVPLGGSYHIGNNWSETH